MKTKELKYIKTKISNNEWKVGNSIYNVKMISNDLKISKYKARQIIQELINACIIEKYNNKFYLLTDLLSFKIKDIQNRLIYKAKVNIIISKLLGQSIYDKKYMAFIKKENNIITVYFPLRKTKTVINILSYNNLNNELNDIIKRNNIK